MRRRAEGSSKPQRRMPPRSAQENRKQARQKYHGRTAREEEEEKASKHTRALRSRPVVPNKRRVSKRDTHVVKKSPRIRALRAASEANAKVERACAKAKSIAKTKPKTKRNNRRKKKQKVSNSSPASSYNLPSLGGRTSVLEYERIELAEGRLNPLFYCFHDLRSPPIV